MERSCNGMVADSAYYTLLSLILLVGFLLRAGLMLRYGWVGKDTFYHFLISRQIKKERTIPKIVDRFVEPEHYDYPPLLHYLLSKIPEGWNQRVQLLAPLTDMFSAMTIFLFSLHNFDATIALIAVTIYCFTPFAIDISFSMGPRVFANFFLIVCVVSTFYEITNGSAIFLIMAILGATLVLLTQRLAVQSLIAILLTEAVVVGNIGPIVILFTSFICSIVISKGFYLTVLKGHIGFVRTMSSRLLDPEKRKEQASPFLDVKSIAFNLPVIFLLPIIFYQSYPWSILSSYLLGWICSLLILSSLWVFGEGYRHMANTVAPLAIVGGAWAIQFNNIIAIMVVISISLILSLYKIIRLSRRRDLGIVVSPQIVEALLYVKEQGKPSDVILAIPTDYSYHVAYFSGAIIAHSSGGFAKGLAYNMKINRMIKEGRVNEIINWLGVRWVLTLNNKLTNVPITRDQAFGPEVHLYEVERASGGISWDAT